MYTIVGVFFCHKTLVSEQMLVVETITTRSNSFLAFKNIVAIYFMENNYLMGLKI